MGRRATLLFLAADAAHARAAGRAAIAERRERRLRDLLATARRFPFYRRSWSGIPAGAPLADLPPVSKKEWVEGFDETVLDREVTYDTLWRHMQGVAAVGKPWLGRYTVCRSSGVSGRKSLFLSDQSTMDVYWALWSLRGWLPWLGARGLARMARRGGRVAALVATNGHYASAAMIRRPSPMGAPANARSATLSILKPAARTARALAYWRPAALVGYPTYLDQLATEVREGRLALDLVVAVSVSESVDPDARARIEAAFGCPLRDSYAASEFLALGFECRERWLHVNADWVVLEPVDEEFRPVAPGVASHTTLVTNLANRTQPVVRHDLGDRVTVRPDACPCGNPLPAVRVEGRQDDVLVYYRAGRAVGLAPLGLITAFGGISGVEGGTQFVQTDLETLSLRIEFRRGTDEDATWSEIERRLRAHLRGQGLPHVRVVRSPIPPSRDPRTGKRLRFWSEAPTEAPSPF